MANDIEAKVRQHHHRRHDHDDEESGGFDHTGQRLGLLGGAGG